MELSVGTSTARPARVAAREAVAAALREARDPAAALVFSTDRYDHRVLASELGDALAGLPWAGCSTAGVIADDVLLGQGLAVGVLGGEGVRAGTGLGGPLSRDPRAAGRDAVRQALESLPSLDPGFSRTVIVLPDAMTSNSTEVLRGAAEEAGSGVHWCGGGSGDNFHLLRAAQFCDGRPSSSDQVVALALDCPERVGVGLRNGWTPYGPPSLVTRAEGMTVLELDDEPAFDTYCRAAAMAGDEVTRDDFAAFAMFHPLGIPQLFGPDLVRDPLEVDARGGLVCVGEIAEGSLVRMMVARIDGLLEVGAQAVDSARHVAGHPLGGALLFDCFSRARIFGGHLEPELARVRHQLGPRVPLMGCLTLGEVASCGRGIPQFHNKTAVVMGW